MLVRNTDAGARGFTVDGIPYRVPGGGELDIPTKIVVSARKDFIVDGWFTEGTLVQVASAPEVATPKAEVKAEPPAPVVAPEPVKAEPVATVEVKAEAPVAPAIVDPKAKAKK
jgi:hypothetical protein